LRYNSFYMKPVVGVFAHPDDEVFVGPGGTLAKFAKEGRDTYLIVATNGEAGQKITDDERGLGEIRREEIEESAKILGIKEVFFLDFKDGTLSNNRYHEVADKIQAILERLDPEIVITMENRGVSGHLDHIAISFITTFVFNKLQSIKELWYFCLTQEAQKVIIKHLGGYFIYFPPGYKKEEITKTIDISSVWDQKIAATKKHASQKPDVEATLKTFEELPKEENYLVLTKDTE
jgi:LmbE family N-acetylglucosaminyl deacetylase